MQEFRELSELKNLKDNTAYVPESVEMRNSLIRFGGKNNILVIEDGVRLYDSQINFNASDSVIFISHSKHITKLNVNIYNSSAFNLGKDNYFNGILNISISEHTNVFIGDDNLFAFGIWVRTADPHLIYSTKTNKRINQSKSVFLGDHIWIGQNVLVLKGTKLHSGSILGAGAVCSGKEISSNCSFAGNPARLIGGDIFWDKTCVHAWDEETTKKNNSFNSDKYIFTYSQKDYIPFDEIDKKLFSLNTAEGKLEYLKELKSKKTKNRFAYFLK